MQSADALPVWGAFAWAWAGFGILIFVAGFPARRSNRKGNYEGAQAYHWYGGWLLAVPVFLLGGWRQPILLTGYLSALLIAWFLDVPGTAGWFLLHFRAPFWALRNRSVYQGYRAVGFPNAYAALLASRVLTVDQARRLGWSSSSLCSLVGWVPVYRARPSRPRRWDVERLIQWAQARPDDGAWYTAPVIQPVEDEDFFVGIYGGNPRSMRRSDWHWMIHRLEAHITLAITTRRALPYLRSPVPGLTLTNVLFFARSPIYLPYQGFEALYAAMRRLPEAESPGRDDGDSLEAVRAVKKLLKKNLTPNGIDRLGWWEIPGWITFDRPTAQRIFLHSDGPKIDAELCAQWRNLMVQWHDVNVKAARNGQHAALWRAAGFSVHEAERLLTSGNAYDTVTLEQMAGRHRTAAADRHGTAAD